MRKTITRHDKILTTVVLCLLAAGAGDAMGRRGRIPWSSPIFQKSAARPQRPDRPVAPTPADDASRQLEARRQAIARTAARCETAALWEWLEKQQDGAASEMSRHVISELYARLGQAAFSQALKIHDPKLRSAVAGILLTYIGYDDPWKALDFYDAHRSDLASGWESGAMTALIMNGCNTSADLVIAAISRHAVSQEDGFEFPALFPPDFDFKKLVDFIHGPDGTTTLIPINLRQAWGAQDPAGAANWLAGHPGDYSTYSDRFSENDTVTLAAIATSTAPGRGQALAALTASLPPDDSATGWKTLGLSYPAFEPQLLDAATAMGQRDTYLIPALLKTRVSEELPAAWAIVPEAERPALLDAVSAQWNATTPADLKARVHWRTRIEQQWTALPGK